MGAVHAKQRGKADILEERDRNEELQDLNLKAKARVDKVSFNGIKRTKSPLLNYAISPLFSAKSFEEVIKTTHEVRTHLNRLGIFKKIAIDIETSKGPESSPYGYEVTFHVHEVDLMSVALSTQLANNEALLSVRGSLTNVLGKAEGLRGEYSYGTLKTNNMALIMSKPFLTKLEPVGSASIFRNDSDWPVSGYRLRDTGMMLDLALSVTSQMRHNLQYEVDWRQLYPSSKYAAFEVREDAGHKLKSALRHILTLDRRDNPIFPVSGTMLKTTVEYSGLGGNINFLKGDLAMQWNVPLIKDVILQAGCNVGHMYKWDESHTVADNFFLGGPLDIRGFNFRSLGPQNDGNFVGGSTYYAASLHIFSPLPFRPGEGGFGDYFRSHLWINAGNCGDFTSDKGGDNHLETIRVAAGIGIAFKLGNVARTEINYCFPLKFLSGDGKVSGIQFGVGMNFL
ncbi:Sorting and assembly machinery [Nesidiocoris tenuis]|uniref:Sorting and assembly machinery n=2 Tax=Nesidiocoris tenuis TaxID=355587 RepID=A0ABN7AHV4_9HEMI|nr:Sorting and assembly machinery [Nesidiocoris tenuis]